MKRTILLTLLVSFIVVSAFASAGGKGGGGKGGGGTPNCATCSCSSPPCAAGCPKCNIPIDGGIGALLLLGLAYGTKKVYDSNRKQPSN